MVITGRTNFLPPSMSPERNRISLDVSDVVLSHLDHIASITGQTKSSIVAACLVESLPDLLARADGLKKRYVELNQQKKKGG